MCTKVLVLAWWMAATALPIAFLLGLVAWLGEPRIGIDAAPDHDGRMEITRVHPGGPAWASGVRAGDMLVRVDGVDISQSTWAQRRDHGVEFLVQRQAASGAGTERIEGGLRPISWGLAASFWAIGGTFAVASFFVFSRSRRSIQVLVLSLMLMAFAVAFLLAPAASRWHPGAVLAEPLIADWATVLFFIFFFLFYRSQQSAGPILNPAPWAMVVVALALMVLYPLSFTAFPELFAVARPIFLAHVVIGLLAGIILLAAAYFSSRSPVVREQSRIMLIGVAAAVLPFALLGVSPQVVGLAPLLRPEVIVLSVILVPLSFTYAIMRHQLMGIRRLVHRGATYALISLAIFIIYGGMIATLRWVGGPRVGENLVVQVLLFAVLCGSIPLISGARRLAFTTIDRVLYREYLDHPNLNREVSIGTASARDIEELRTHGLEPIVQELRLSFAAFIGVAEDRVTPKIVVGHLPAEIADHLTALTSRPEEDTVSFAEVTTGSHPGQTVLVTVRGGQQKHWILCLGPKTSEEPFIREDLDLAQSLAGHFATIMEKLELLEELQTKAEELRQLNRRLIRTQEEERSRIASYLHDEPLQQISSLIWHHATVDLSPRVQRQLQGIAEDLRNFTARLQPAVLEDLGLVRALEWLGTEASTAAGFKFIFDPGDLRRDQRLDQEVELAVYRISQEALTNCQRHALATTVWLRLHFQKNTLRITVKDDGVGFDRDGVTKPGIRLGLVGIRERTEQLGGQVQMAARKPSGTQLLVSLPLPQGKLGTKFSIS